MPKATISTKDKIVALFSTLSTEEARSVRDSINAILAHKREATAKPKQRKQKSNAGVTTNNAGEPQLDDFGR